jgi:ATP-dependent DNA helicase RecG
MKHSNIIEIIQQGENSAIEFKSADVKTDSLAKEIIAFANMNGGIILIGIEDDRTISGVSKEKNWEEWTMNIVRNNINPPINICFQYIELNQKIIASITVEKGKNKPYQTIDGKYYIRIGSTNRIASIVELMRLFQESGVFHYDLCKVDKTSIKSLNYNTIAEYFKRFEIDFEKETDENRANLLTNTDILTENGEVTLAGLLVFGINPARYLFQTGITFVHYNGNDVTGAIIDSKHIEGDMDYIISTAFTSIKNNILTPSVIIGLKRVDTKEIYPDKVFRELITNCCAHRNYAITGSKIRILLFHNRIEFISPGKLPNTITIDKLSAGVSYRRNQLLTKFMVVLRLMDTFGRGLPNVIAEAKRLKKSILFEEIGEEFKVTLEL